MNDKKLLQMLKKSIAGKSLRSAAREIGINHAYLREILMGAKSVSNPKILRKFGLKKVMNLIKNTP